MPKLLTLRAKVERTGNFAGAGDDLETGPLTPIHGGSPPKEGFEEAQLEEFYSIISQVKLNTYKLKQNTKKVKQIGEQFMESLQDPDLKKQKEEALQVEKEAAAQITGSTGALFQQLKKLEDTKTAEMGDTSGMEAGARMILTASGAARQNWKEAMKGYIETEKKIQAELRERLRRHLRIADGHEPSEEQLDILEDEAPDVFAQAMMGKADMALAKGANEYAHNKEEQVKHIRDKQEEILELWAQLGIVMDQQSETLNNIFNNVEQAKEYVKEANNELKVVPGMNAQRHRCYCFIIIGLLVILVAVAIPLWISTSSSDDSAARRRALATFESLRDSRS